MPLRVVEHGPGQLTHRISSRLDETIRSNAFDSRLKIGGFEEDHSLVRGGIGLDTSLFKTNKGVASVELDVMPELFIMNRKAKCVLIKLSRRHQIIEVEFDSR